MAASWTAAESLQLVQSFIDTRDTWGDSFDVSTFWVRLQENYNSVFPNNPRVRDSLIAKWRSIRKEINEFNDIVRELHVQRFGGLPPPGIPDDNNLITAAKLLFLERQGHIFAYEDAWALYFGV